MIVQIIGFGSGILLVRNLSKQDYALFTIANTIMGTMGLIGDSGVSSGLSAIGGRIWANPTSLGRLIKTAFCLRQRFLGFVAFVGTPIGAWLLLRNGASVQITLIVSMAILVSLFFQMGNGILNTIPRLLLQTKRLQMIDLSSASIRLLLLTLAWLVCLNVSTALWAATGAFALQWWLLQRWTRSHIDQNASHDPEMRREIVAIVRKQAPNVIYYCLQGQIAIFLVSILGSTSKVADLGALGRLAVVFTITGSIMSSIVVPRFSRNHNPDLLYRRYFQVIAVFLGLTTTLVIGAGLFPKPLLWLLGSQYTHLDHELILIVLAAAISTLTGAMWSINFSKGWFLPPVINISGAVTTQAISLCFLDLSTVRGAILFGMLPYFPEGIFHFLCTQNGIKKLRSSSLGT